MFCEQCEQTASGQGCHQWGACGKSPEVNAVQDLLMYCVRSIAPVALRAKALHLSTAAVDRFTTEAIFATMTNVNFDAKRFSAYIRRTIAHRQALKDQVQAAVDAPQSWPAIASYTPDFEDNLSIQGQDLALQFISQAGADVDIFSLKLTVLYGIKGVASYAFHAQELGQTDDRVYEFIYEALAALDQSDLTLTDWVNLALQVGEINLRTMELLDAGHTGAYGHPIPTPVPLNARAGKAILVSGHDIPQLEAVLKQTLNTGITVYTHGELLPAHGYPQLKAAYPHLYGHYGTAWQNQTRDFAKFPGAVIITTNCLMPPHEHYEDKLFCVGPVGYPGLQIIPPGLDGVPDYAPAIQKALALPGFATDTPDRQVTTGFARNAVLGVADQVLAAVKAGKIRHFFLIGGCDGAKPDRNYYTELVEKVPDDCVILTLACGKFRFFDQDLGNIDGIPRLLDVGQCNDAYSAIQIAIALAQALEVEVNQLPLSMILSWYEQKAIAILLTLLYLGIEDIRLGPTLPAFISPNVLQLLSDRYHLQPITSPEADLAACLG